MLIGTNYYINTSTSPFKLDLTGPPLMPTVLLTEVTIGDKTCIEVFVKLHTSIGDVEMISSNGRVFAKLVYCVSKVKTESPEWRLPSLAFEDYGLVNYVETRSVIDKDIVLSEPIRTIPECMLEDVLFVTERLLNEGMHMRV